MADFSMEMRLGKFRATVFGDSTGSYSPDVAHDLAARCLELWRAGLEDLKSTGMFEVESEDEASE